jgi:hypothetical protein
MLDSMIMGDAKARQNAQGYGTPQQMQNRAQMDMMEAEFQRMQHQERMGKPEYLYLCLCRPAVRIHANQHNVKSLPAAARPQ